MNPTQRVPNGARPADTYAVEYACACGNRLEIAVGVKVGQTFVQAPDLWCVKCDPARRMQVLAPRKRAVSPIVQADPRIDPNRLKS